MNIYITKLLSSNYFHFYSLMSKYRISRASTLNLYMQFNEYININITIFMGLLLVDLIFLVLCSGILVDSDLLTE